MAASTAATLVWFGVEPTAGLADVVELEGAGVGGTVCLDSTNWANLPSSISQMLPLARP